MVDYKTKGAVQSIGRGCATEATPAARFTWDGPWTPIYQVLLSRTPWMDKSIIDDAINDSRDGHLPACMRVNDQRLL